MHVSKKALNFALNSQCKAPVAPGLRPGYDLPATEKCWNHGQIVERTYDWLQRSWVIARAKSVAARSWSFSKRSHTGLAIEKCWNHGQIVERMYDWSQRSYNWSQRLWMIVRGKSVSTRSMVMFKTFLPAIPNRKRSHD